MPFRSAPRSACCAALAAPAFKTILPSEFLLEVAAGTVGTPALLR